MKPVKVSKNSKSTNELQFAQPKRYNYRAKMETK